LQLCAEFAVHSRVGVVASPKVRIRANGRDHLSAQVVILIAPSYSRSLQLLSQASFRFKLLLEVGNFLQGNSQLAFGVQNGLWLDLVIKRGFVNLNQ
jgi:hypothetical protein